MKILYIGDDWVGSNARSLANGFRQAGHDVIVVDSTSVTLPKRMSPPWLYSKVQVQRAPWRVEALHSRIDHIAAEFRPDMVFGFKSIYLDQQRLLDVPARLHVHYSPDDVFNQCNTSPDYLRFEGEWDVIITTKRFNAPELLERGARAVKFVMSAYDPAWHHLSARHDPRRYLVGFIGACRPDRRGHVISLARTYGERMLVRGPGWRRVAELQRTRAKIGGPVYGEGYSSEISSVTANLVLLNSDNRDTHTCRTFEVPASGGLFVGERTDEHADLLADGQECVLFSDQEELRAVLEMCRHCPDTVHRIAESGHRRIVEGSHRYVDRAREIVDAIG